MTQLNGGQALIQQLHQEGIQVVFGIPGQGQYEAVDALYEHPTIRYITLRNEQAASYMADGYARASGKIAAALVVQGPGFFNAAAGMATAHAVSSPMLLITGPHHLKHKQVDANRNTPSASLQAVTKWTARATRPAEIPALIHAAMRQLKSGRPGPVGLEIAPSVFAATEAVALLPAAACSPVVPDAAVVRKAATALAAAQRPLIWAGGGVQRAGAGKALQALAEALQAPVVTSRQGKGAISDRHPLSLGYAELRYAPLRDWLHSCDLILAIGTSTSFANYTQPVIQVDVDATQISSGGQVTALVGDAKATLCKLHESLRAQMSGTAAARPAIHAEVARLNAARFDPAEQLQPQWDLMQAIRRALPDDAIVVQGMNQMGYYSRNYFPVHAERGYLTSSALATLGCALPLALGAKVAEPARPVVALSGDGGFLYNSQELATAVHYQIPVIVLLFNDNAYGNVLRAQQEQFDGRVIGTKLHNPDFVQLAQSYGARGLLAADAAAVERALADALHAKLPTVIEVPVGPMQRVY